MCVCDLISKLGDDVLQYKMGGRGKATNFQNCGLNLALNLVKLPNWPL